MKPLKEHINTKIVNTSDNNNSTIHNDVTHDNSNTGTTNNTFKDNNIVNGNSNTNSNEIANNINRNFGTDTKSDEYNTIITGKSKIKRSLNDITIKILSKIFGCINNTIAIYNNYMYHRDIRSITYKRVNFIFAVLILLIAMFLYNKFLVSHDDNVLSEKFMSKFSVKNIVKNLLKSGYIGPYKPVILIPGVISTGLEVWHGPTGTNSCPKTSDYERERIWGSPSMIKFLLFHGPDCWLKFLRLDPVTGLDYNYNCPNPDGTISVSANITNSEGLCGVRVRPLEGLHAADYFLGPYWVWGRIIQSLIDVGYDYDVNLLFASYDWRLAFKDIEIRDNYFTWLKSKIETLVKINNKGIYPPKKKVVLIAHSMGALVIHYFLNWATHIDGPLSRNWVELNVDSVVYLGGPMLGASKIVSALFSGEMKDTAELGKLLETLKDKVFSKPDLALFFRNIRSIFSMYPKFSGSSSSNNLDPKHVLKPWPENVVEFGPEIDLEKFFPDFYQKYPNLKSSSNITTLDTKQVLDLLGLIDSDNYTDIITQLYSIGGYENTNHTPTMVPYSQSLWSNPLQSPLPPAPSLTIYSFYGIGKATEYSYRYQLNPDYIDNAKIAGDTRISNIDTKNSIPFIIDKDYFSYKTENNTNARDCRYGVCLTNGDGTVPLYSLAYMSEVGWKNNTYLNPHNVKTVTREYSSGFNISYNDTNETIATDTFNNISTECDNNGICESTSAKYFFSRLWDHFHNFQNNLNLNLNFYLDFDFDFDIFVDNLFRGGHGGSIDHIDLLGNAELITDILKIIGQFNVTTDSSYSADFIYPETRIFTDHNKLFKDKFLDL